MIRSDYVNDLDVTNVLNEKNISKCHTCIEEKDITLNPIIGDVDLKKHFEKALVFSAESPKFYIDINAPKQKLDPNEVNLINKRFPPEHFEKMKKYPVKDVGADDGEKITTERHIMDEEELKKLRDFFEIECNFFNQEIKEN